MSSAAPTSISDHILARLATPREAAPFHAPTCRFCGTTLAHTFVDLGTSPLCQRHVTQARFNHSESFYPLHVYVCHECFLVQLPQYVAREEIFDGDYGYFSSFSDTWLKHAKDYTEQMIARFGLGAKSRVVEVASNDGYLLQYFVQQGIPCLGIEPTANTAEAAEKKGVKSLVRFFGRETAHDVRQIYGPADLLLGNNVLAHVPDINDFVAGLKILLSDRGVVTMEFPVLSKLIANNYFDTIYHEHFSYLSFTTVERIFAQHGMTLFDVDRLTTHGGSIRIYARHQEDQSKPVSDNVTAIKAEERALGHFDLDYYASFGEKVRETKRKVLEFLIEAKRNGKTIAAYGAPGKGNTLLNYCGVRTDFIDYTVDRSPHKQGNFLPGTRIPILSPDEVMRTRPDYLFILIWNLKDEVMKQMGFIREWGGQFVVPLPELEVL
ncbi:MAG: methyltransferase domain-containing protein [Burkholderiales bacterium]|nr:methyltransferase domain-containing protein [Phycisphaerae bacterium]